MQKELCRIAAVFAICFGISAVVQTVRGTALGQGLPSISVGPAVEAAGWSVQQREFSEVTEVFSGLLTTGEEDAVSVSSSSELERSDAEE